MNGVPAGYGLNPTPEIQAEWLKDLSDKMIAAGGIGIVYWEPDWVASNANACPAEFGGSAWENVALFDFNNNLMPNGGILFCQLPTGINSQITSTDDISFTCFPNPVIDELNIRFNLITQAETVFEIYDMQGRIITTFTKKSKIGSNCFTLNLKDLKIESGSYILRLIINGVYYNQTFTLDK
jgi:arabinogalactan endo-1,4-beta-galactosidase